MMYVNNSKLKYFTFYILMFIFTFTICFLVLEVAAKFYYSNLTEVSNTMFDPTLGWCLRPGLYMIKPPHTFKKHSIYINNLGLRNHDISLQKKEIKSIIILGDSFTYAGSVRENKIFSTQLEKKINEISKNKYEIVNCGVPGYGTAQELLIMKDLFSNGMTGDLYLLMIFTNDILDNLRLDYGNLQEISAKPGFVLLSDGSLELKYLPQEEFSQNSDNFISAKKKSKRIKIIEIIKIKIQSFLQTRPKLVEILNRLGINAKLSRMPGLLNGWYKQDILDDGLPLMKALIKEIKQEAEKVGAKLLVCIIPSPIQVYPDVYGKILKRTFPDNPQVKYFLEDIKRPQNAIIQKCQELRISYLDLYPIFIENSDQELFIPGDGHFNENGHILTTNSLVKFIIQHIE